MAAPRYIDLPTTEFGRLADDTVFVLPLGAIEQHGPHLPVSTDYTVADMTADAAVEAAAAAGVPALLLPTLAFTKSDEHSRFPGSIWLDWDTMMRTLIDIGRSLAATPVSRLVFINGHGGNSAIAQVACRELRKQFGLRTFLTGPYSGMDFSLSPASERGMSVHAMYLETSLMLHLRPDLVRMEHAAACVPEALLDFEHIGFNRKASFGWLADDLSDTGVIGDPTAATAEVGAGLFESAVAHLAAVIGEASRFRTR